MQALRVPPETLDRLRAALERRAASPVETASKYEAWRLEMGRFQVVAYRSGKLTLSDARLEPFLAEALEGVLPRVGHPLVGSDEAGKGEWLGPLVAAACAVLPGERARLVAAGVMDSKELSRGALPVVAGRIEREQPHRSIVLVAPPRFNELWPRFKQEGKSLNDLLAWAHAKALGDVLGKLEAAGVAEGARVLVDQFDRVRTEARASRAFDVARYPVEQRPRAEDEVAVAAASVLAKAARERWIDAYERRAGVPVRSFTMDQARAHSKAGEFAKVGFLSRG